MCFEYMHFKNVTHRIESCIASWMSQVIGVYESCLAYERVILQRCFDYMHFTSKRLESCHTYEWVRWYTRMSCVIDMNELFHTCVESCLTYECVLSYIRMSHVIYMLSYVYERVIPYVCMSHVSHVNVLWYRVASSAPFEGKRLESWNPDECVMSDMYMTFIVHVNASCHTYEWVMSPRFCVT